jgi:ABC-type nitrate/sulfonate/bicarbonate transport system permease component
VKSIARFVMLLALWELLGDFHLIAQGALPSPSAIFVQGWQDRAVYPQHIWATLQPALLGFVIGNLFAVAAAFAFVLVPAFEGLMRGFNVALFGIPPIALSPVLVITLPGEWPQIVLASVGVYFPTMVMTLLGLRDIDPRPIDVIRCYGGGAFAVLRWLRVRACMPGLLGGLRVAAPAAILGAILLGSLGRGNPARIWGIGLTATLMAALAYALCGLLGRRFSTSLTSVTLAGGKVPDAAARTAASRASQALLALAACGVPFLIWWGILKGFGVSPVIAKTPLAVWQYLFSAPDAADSRAAILQALKESLPPAGIGLLIALTVALSLAVMGMLWRALTSMLMPAALILQTMPLVALTPMIVLLFGRGIAATLIITVIVTFFPAFITIAQGLGQVPQASLDLLAVYGANRRQKLALVSLPMSLPYLCAAARLVAPASLLGVMIAEWLATGYGLGNLLNTARGELDYGMIWAVAFVAVAVSVGFYQLVKLLEDAVLRRYSAAAASG